MLVKTLHLENEKSFSFAKDAFVVLLSSLLIGLLGQISIPLPFTPVPIVTQLQFILTLSVLLGARRGASAVFAFIVQGAMGLPVFAKGSAGIAVLAGPTGGYLIGYFFAAYLTGWIIEKSKERSLKTAFMAICSGNALVYLFGASYLAVFMGFQKAFLLGIAPFIIGDLLKIAISLKVLQFFGWNKR